MVCCAHPIGRSVSGKPDPASSVRPFAIRRKRLYSGCQISVWLWR